MTRTLIMSPERVQRTIRRLAYEVVERNRGAQNLEIFGILQSGVALAETLTREINRIGGDGLAARDLDVTPYRDDRNAASEEGPSSVPIDVTDRDVILVDDVLFTGRTARAALDAIIQLGRPRSIQLAVLVDRGHREYPIQPDYIGRQIQTKHRERIAVAAEDDTFAVYVED